jgi:hypothetical protein
MYPLNVAHVTDRDVSYSQVLALLHHRPCEWVSSCQLITQLRLGDDARRAAEEVGRGLVNIFSMQHLLVITHFCLAYKENKNGKLR